MLKYNYNTRNLSVHVTCYLNHSVHVPTQGLVNLTVKIVHKQGEMKPIFLKKHKLV